MANITLKDVPEDLHARLKEAAVAEGRSLNKEILVRLKLSTMLERRPPVTEILASAAKARSLFKEGVSERELDRWKRQGRP